jgi:YggT family protein
MGDLVAASLPASGLLADTGSSVAQFVGTFIFVYILLLFAYILTSWIRLPYRPWLNRVQRFLYDVCDPYLRIFRRFIPPLGPLDLSPMIGVITLIVLDRLLTALIEAVL